MKLVMLVGTIGLLVAAAASAPGDIVAPRKPWTPPQLSTANYEATPTFSPDGREIVYLSADRNFAKWRLLMARCEDGRWSRPVPPPFAAKQPVIEADPGYTPDGKGLYFVSARHDPKNEDFDIWHVSRSGDGSWGAPERLPAPVNSGESELLPRADLSGRLFFGSSRPGGHGQSDIYVAERVEDGWRVRNLGPPVSTAAKEYEAEISRDGRTLILVADRGQGSRLYRFEASGTGWRETGRIVARTDVFQVGPLLSPDSQTLLFAQAERGRSGEIFRVDLAENGKQHWPAPCRNRPVGLELTRRAAAAGMLSLAGHAAPARNRGRPIEPSATAYAQAWLIEAPTRLLFVSGQVPTDADGAAPKGFVAQARLAWTNVLTKLRQADMDVENLAKVTIYLSDRSYRADNTRVRVEMLGSATPAITVIIAGIFDESWLLEIEAIACG